MIYKILVHAATISHALMAGTFFAFSAFIMAALARTDAAGAARTMQSINVVILRSPFLPLFLLSALLSVGLPIYAWFSGDRQAVLPLAASGAFYFIGIFVVTMVFNVPLNDKLDATQPQNLATYWPQYVAAWLPWNHVRTIAGILATLTLICSRLIR